jgi:hypothetical protein
VLSPTGSFIRGPSGTQRAAEYLSAAKAVEREIARVEEHWDVVRRERGYAEPEASAVEEPHRRRVVEEDPPRRFRRIF